jgi:hypothetical protein
MTTDGLEHQLPINAVEEALDVEIENPIVAPAALASLAHGINRRFAGPVAIGIGVEHRLQDRLQIATGDLLGNAVGDRWNPQRPRPCAARRYSRPRGWNRLWLVPSRRHETSGGRDAAQVLTFRTTAWSSFALPTRRMPLGQYQDIHRADPGGWISPRF